MSRKARAQVSKLLLPTSRAHATLHPLSSPVSLAAVGKGCTSGDWPVFARVAGAGCQRRTPSRVLEKAGAQLCWDVGLDTPSTFPCLCLPTQHPTLLLHVGACGSHRAWGGLQGHPQ